MSVCACAFWCVSASGTEYVCWCLFVFETEDKVKRVRCGGERE